MQSILTRPRLGRAGIVQLPVNEIDPNPNQPRKLFDDSQLAELSASIAEYGVISPLTVRLHFGRYELVAGERRLRAARMAGLKKVPCIVLDVNMEESSMLAMVENLQRQDLDFLEEARGIANLMRMYGLSQEECARRLGRSQSSVANKLRLLKLPDDVLAALRDNGLTERHGRALLRLLDAESRRAALAHIVQEGLNVAQTETYLRQLMGEESPAEKPKRIVLVRDVRIFVNTIRHAVDLMKQNGIRAESEWTETDDYLEYVVKIPRSEGERRRAARTP